MIRSICSQFISLAAIVLLSSCNNAPVSEIKESVPIESTSSALPDAIFDSYYAGQKDSAYEYFQHSKIQKFLAMWVTEEIEDFGSPQWDYDGFTKISVLDHDFVESRPDEELYYLPFSDGADRYGYVIAVYHEADPSISNWSIRETTPYLYDLKANEEKIAESLLKTDIDLSTAKAARVSLFDKEKKRGDQVIRFTDDKGQSYICYFGDDSFEIEKW